MTYTEAEYAHYSLHKPVIPLRMESGYEPDGWLRPICQNNRCYDFSSPEHYDSEWAKLHIKLCELIPSGLWARLSYVAVTIKIPAPKIWNSFYLLTFCNVKPSGSSFRRYFKIHYFWHHIALRWSFIKRSASQPILPPTAHSECTLIFSETFVLYKLLTYLLILGCSVR